MSADAAPAAAGPVFEAANLTFRYPGSAIAAVDDVGILVDPGSLYAVIGPNGSGKSTLLRLLLGAAAPAWGSVRYRGRAVGDWGRREMAREIGVVPQREEVVFPMRVRELVEMGRYPHLGPFRPAGAADRAAVLEALAHCDLLDLADRPLSTLSGGERQRARLARALAQRPAALVLDEPTTSLDVRHEMETFELLRKLSVIDRKTVVVVTHDLNLAARYADRLLLMDLGRAAAEGPPDEVLSLPVLERVYRWPLAVTRHPGPGADAGVPQVVALRPEIAERADVSPEPPRTGTAGRHADAAGPEALTRRLRSTPDPRSEP